MNTKLSELHKERARAELGAEDMFWSPQEKEKCIKKIDEEILQEEYKKGN